MKKRSKFSLLNVSPKCWGLIYIVLIPVFALIYLLLPDNSFFELQNSFDCKSALQCLYFSTITITTLGFGDFYPITPMARIFVMGETILGMVVIGLFLNSVAFLKTKIDADAEKIKSKEDYIHQEKLKLSRYYSILQREIKRYYRYTIIITHPMSERGRAKNYNPDFSFHDLADLFMDTMKLTDATYEPAINYYYRCQSELAHTLKSILLSIDLKYWRELETDIVQILENIRILDFEKYILNQPNMRVGKEKASEFDAKMIRDWDQEIEFRPSSGANAYIALYKLIKLNMPLIDKVEKEILTIVNE